jgi:hypothetical protein
MMSLRAITAVQDRGPGWPPPAGAGRPLSRCSPGSSASAVSQVAAATDPAWEPGRDRLQQYREHVIASLRASPWALVINVPDFTDNAKSLFYTTGPKLPELATKYRPLVAPLHELVLRPDTPLNPTSRT